MARFFGGRGGGDGSWVGPVLGDGAGLIFRNDYSRLRAEVEAEREAEVGDEKKKPPMVRRAVPVVDGKRVLRARMTPESVRGRQDRAGDGTDAGVAPQAGMHAPRMDASAGAGVAPQAGTPVPREGLRAGMPRATGGGSG